MSEVDFDKRRLEGKDETKGSLIIYVPSNKIGKRSRKSKN